MIIHIVQKCHASWRGSFTCDPELKPGEEWFERRTHCEGEACPRVGDFVETPPLALSYAGTLAPLVGVVTEVRWSRPGERLVPTIRLADRGPR